MLNFNPHLAVRIAIRIVTVGYEFNEASDDVSLHGIAGILVKCSSAVGNSVLFPLVLLKPIAMLGVQQLQNSNSSSLPAA